MKGQAETAAGLDRDRGGEQTEKQKLLGSIFCLFSLF